MSAGSISINALIKLIEGSKVTVRVPAQKCTQFYDTHVEVVDASRLVKQLHLLDKKVNPNA